VDYKNLPTLTTRLAIIASLSDKLFTDCKLLVMNCINALAHSGTSTLTSDHINDRTEAGNDRVYALLCITNEACCGKVDVMLSTAMMQLLNADRRSSN